MAPNRARRGPRWRFGLGCALGCVAMLAGCHKASIAGRPPEKIIGDHGLGPGQFVYPRAIAAAPDGCIFVADKTGRIQRFSPEGEVEAWWRMPEWQAGKPTGMSVDAAGRLLVADTHYHRVVVFDRDGRELTRFGSAGNAPGQFQLPTCVVADRAGNLYVSEYGGNDRISRFSPQFEYQGSFGGPKDGEASLLRPEALAFDAEGMLWVADACHHRICRFTPEGKLLSTFGSAGHEPGQLQYPYDVACCPDGTLLICEFGNNRVQRFDARGKSLETWGRVGSQPGELAYPWGLAVGLKNRVYVVDSGNNRVQMFRM